MTYATANQLRLTTETLIWLTRDEDGARSPDQVVIEEQLAAADARIDSFLRQRYDLPLADPDPELARIAVSLTRMFLYERRPDGPDIPQAITDAYERAMQALKDLRDGKRSLAASSTDAAPVAEPGRVKVRTPARRFSADVLDRY